MYVSSTATDRERAQDSPPTYPKSNGSLRQGGLPLREALGAALLAGSSMLLLGCPGPEPHAGVGGNGGEGTTTGVTITDTTTMSRSSTTVSTSSITVSTSSISSCGPSEMCVPPTPSGWTGPVQIYQGKSTTCPQGMSGKLLGGTNPAIVPAICPTCMCTLPTQLSCGTPTANVWTSSSCTGSSPCASADLSTTSCSLVKASNATSCGQSTAGLFVTVTVPIVGGNCGTVSTGPMSLPQESWTTNAVACSASNTIMACENGMICAPDPDPTAHYQVCIYQTGDVPSCTSPTYPNKSTIYTTFTEGRSCNPCNCGAPTGKCMNSAVSFSATSDAASCPGTVPGQPVPLPCTQLGIPGTSAYYAALIGDPTLDSPSCSPLPGSGAPDGGVTESGPITLCCM